MRLTISPGCPTEQIYKFVFSQAWFGRFMCVKVVSMLLSCPLLRFTWHLLLLLAVTSLRRLYREYHGLQGSTRFRFSPSACFRHNILFCRPWELGKVVCSCKLLFSSVNTELSVAERMANIGDAYSV